MVDNRAAGFYGIGGSFNFKSGDISGTAAKTSDDRSSQGTEYAAPGQGEDENESGYRNEPFVDRSAQLRATLNSLAMMNVASVINSKLPQKTKQFSEILEDSEKIEPVKEKSKNKHKNSKDKKKKLKVSKKQVDLEEAFY